MQPSPASRPIQNPIIRWLVYSHIWLALGAAAQVWWTMKIMGDDVLMDMMMVVAFCGTVAVYGFMRLMRAKGLLVEVVPLFGWVDRNRMGVVLMILVSVVVAGIYSHLIFFFSWDLWLWVLPICVLYVLPFGYPNRYIGLRALPFIKSFLIALVWAMVTVVIPLRLGFMSPEPDPMVFTLQRALLIMALVIAFDIRDVEVDPPDLCTIPQLMGVRYARLFAYTLILLSAAVLWFIYTQLGFSSNERWAFILPIIGHVYLLWAVSRTGRENSETFYGLALDGSLILLPVLAWLGSML